MPKHSILLIEDIDCAFPVLRDSDDHTETEDIDSALASAYHPARPARHAPRSAVTLSGLLNVVDGVGSEEGKLFFATV